MSTERLLPDNFVAPQRISDHQPVAGALKGSGIGLITINFNTAYQTLRCVESLRESTITPDWVFVLDNASAADNVEQLKNRMQSLPYSEVRIFQASVNLGFAAGSNFLIDELMAIPECSHVMLLNNDAVALPSMLEELLSVLKQTKAPAGLAGGRMHRLTAPDEVDTLGIALYASLMPADRKTLDDPFLGPTGGCCLMTREVIEHLLTVSGYCFDPRFFCYCEDTDMVLRALLLGYHPAYTDKLIALHEGQASTGGTNNFIAYHGLRNVMWMHLKLFSPKIFLHHGYLLAIAHILSVGKHLIQGNIATVRKIYVDAWRGRQQFRRERNSLDGQGIRIRHEHRKNYIAKNFYRKNYFAATLKGMIANLKA